MRREWEKTARNGKEAYREAMAPGPKMQCILMGGYSEDNFGMEDFCDPGTEDLHKPAAPTDPSRNTREVPDR